MPAVEEAKTKHLNTYLIDACDSALVEAVAAVEDGKVAQADVTVTFSVKQDPEEGLVVAWKLRDVTTRKGTWKPSAFGQMTLLEEG